jgi:hypothetical protein
LRAHRRNPYHGRAALLSEPYAAASDPTPRIEHPVAGLDGSDFGEHPICFEQTLRV